MPTPLEILLDPISLTLLIIYATFIVIELINPSAPLKKIDGWFMKCTLVFIVYFYLSSYLPLIWDKYLLPYQLFDLTAINTIFSTLTALLVFELLIYFWHRTMHRNNILWRVFHQMHHSAERLDTFGTFYFSPFDMIGFTFIGSLTLSIFVGLSPDAVTWFLYINMILVIFQHSNIKTPQWIGYIIQSPESHSIHHKRGVHAFNYSDFPIFDIIFGTFKNPKKFDYDVGFYEGSSHKMKDILLFKDISEQQS